MQDLWKLREACPEALIKEGKCYKYDISIPTRYVIVAVKLENVTP